MRVLARALAATTASLVLLAARADAQDASRPGKDPDYFEVYAELVPGVRLNVDIPDELELTPTHPDDIGPARPERNQPAPLDELTTTWAMAVGVRVKPLRSGAWRNFTIGYRAVFLSTDDHFRRGSFHTRQSYRYFVGDEFTHTYTVMYPNGPINEIRTTYSIDVLNEPSGANVMELEVGAKYALHSFTVRQGWDRHDGDQVYRAVRGTGAAVTPILHLNVHSSGGLLISAGIEMENARVRFDGTPGRGTLKGFSYFFGAGYAR